MNIIKYEVIGDKIRRARIDQQLTQEVLAERTDLSVTHISAIENGKSGLSLQALVDIACELGVSIDFLLFDDLQPKLFFESEVRHLLSGCDEREARFLLALMRSGKDALGGYDEKK